MKILLINPPIREWAKPNCFPSGLGYLAATLTRAGHDVEIFDINVHRPTDAEFDARIAASDYDLCGIGGLITIYATIKRLATRIKTIHPGRPLIIGGSCATSAPHVTLTNTPADYLCIGEGEITLVELAGALASGGPIDTIPGIWRRDSSGNPVANPPRGYIKNIDTIPFPKWDLFDSDIYAINPIGAVNVNKWIDGSSSDENIRRSFNIISSRGCPYKCTYCYHDFMGASYRFRSAENIFEEFVLLKEKYNVEYIHFNDDCFIVNRENVLRFCDILIRENIGVEWGCAGRVNLMSEPLIERMKEAGCVMLCYGIESGSPEVLRRCRKSVNVEQAKTAIRMTQKIMGWADCSFIVGLPGENRDTLRETVDFCKELGLAPEVFFFATPYPGTELYTIARDMGAIPDEEAYILTLGEQGEKVRINFTDFSDDELNEIKINLVRELKAWNTITHE